MAEEKTNELLNRIEKLIIDGNKETLEKIASVETSLRGEIMSVETSLRGEIQEVKQELGIVKQVVKNVHVNLKKEIDVTSGALDYEIKQVGKSVEAVGRKLDDHVKMPAFGG